MFPASRARVLQECRLRANQASPLRPLCSIGNAHAANTMPLHEPESRDSRSAPSHQDRPRVPVAIPRPHPPRFRARCRLARHSRNERRQWPRPSSPADHAPLRSVKRSARSRSNLCAAARHMRQAWRAPSSRASPRAGRYRSVGLRYGSHRTLRHAPRRSFAPKAHEKMRSLPADPNCNAKGRATGGKGQDQPPPWCIPKSEGGKGLC